MRAALVLALLLGLPSIAAGQEARLVARGPDGVWTTGPIQARVGEPIEVRAAVRERDGTILSSVSPLRWDGRRVRARGPLAASVRFERVIPRMQHVDRPPPNPGIPSYSNAVLTGASHGDWIGIDALEYVEGPVAEGRDLAIEGARAVVRGAGVPGIGERGGAGSIWLAADVVLSDGRTLRTPDASSVDRFGLRPEVLRISFREGEDLVGWLATYFGVPNVFGSHGMHQAERYVGADCADVLVGARRAMGATLPYASVAGLATIARPVSEIARQRADGTLDRPLAWGRDVVRGDLAAIDYVEAGDHTLPRAWDHVGALVGDDGDGVLDGDDVLRHMTRDGLEDRPLGREGEIRIRLWRMR